MERQASFFLFIGSGFSIREGGASWMQLRDLAVHQMIGHISRFSTEETWKQICNHAVNRASNLRTKKLLHRYLQKPEFATWILGEYLGGTWELSRFLKRSLLPSPSVNHVLTVQKAIEMNGLIITTEFDGHFATALRYITPLQISKSSFTLSSPPKPRRARMFFTGNRNYPVVIELHGSVEKHRSLVCYPEQIARWESENDCKYIANIIKHTRHAIFWGCGGNDPDICDLFSKLFDGRPPLESTIVVDLEERKNSMLGRLGKKQSALWGKMRLIACDNKTDIAIWSEIEEYLHN